MKLMRERLVDLAAGEVEAGNVAIVRKAGGLELIGVDRTSLSAVSAFRSWDRIGNAASKAGEPCSVSSPTACLSADKPLQRHDPSFILLEKIGGLVEAAGLVLLNPNPDQVPTDIVPRGEPVEKSRRPGTPGRPGA